MKRLFLAVLAVTLSLLTLASSLQANDRRAHRERNYPGLVAETVALRSRMTDIPATQRYILINYTIRDAKNFAIFQQLDVLYAFAAHSQQPALLNWVKNAHNATAVNAPTFTANQGFTGDGASTSINSNYTPSTQAVKYALNFAHASAYVRTTAAASNDKSEFGGGTLATNATVLLIAKGASNHLRHRLNGTVNATGITFADERAFIAVDRSTPSVVLTMRNGIQVGSQSVSSSGLPDASLYILAGNFTVEGVIGWTDRQVSLVSFGASLTASQHYHFNRIIEYYMDQVGSGVQ